MSVAGPSHALAIQFRVTDLVNTTPGEDLWRYDYRVGNRAFMTGQGFFIEFDYNTVRQLQDPPPAVNGDWDPQVTQPDLILTDNGLYDAWALVDSPSLADLFSVTFVWSGGATGPGPQPYTLYDANFNVIETGRTAPAVPTSAPAALIVIGLFGLAATRRRRVRTPKSHALARSHSGPRPGAPTHRAGGRGGLRDRRALAGLSQISQRLRRSGISS